MHVAVGVIRNDRNQILIARRAPGVHQAGFWEFPGGKVEPGESVCEALRRELQEELGILAGAASPLIQVDHDYGDRRVFLDVWTVHSFTGEPRGRQGQPLMWVDAEDLPKIRFPPANRPIVTAARLPDCYVILDLHSGNVQQFEATLERFVGLGLRLVQLRGPALDPGEFRIVAARAATFCRERGVTLLLNAEPELAIDLDADGIHLNGKRLTELSERPLPLSSWVAASCHCLRELRQAERIGADFVVLSPVALTLTHPEAKPLGWPGFRCLARQVALPVYALGGLTLRDLPDARAAGAQGIAGIRGFLVGTPNDGAH